MTMEQLQIELFDQTLNLEDSIEIPMQMLKSNSVSESNINSAAAATSITKRKRKQSFEGARQEEEGKKAKMHLWEMDPNSKEISQEMKEKILKAQKSKQFRLSQGEKKSRYEIEIEALRNQLMLTNNQLQQAVNDNLRLQQENALLRAGIINGSDDIGTHMQEVFRR